MKGFARPFVPILLVLLCGVGHAAAPDAAVLPVRGSLDAAQAARLAAELEQATARGAGAILLEVDLVSASAEPSATLAAAVRKAAADTRVAALLTGNAPGAALSVLLACPTRLVGPEGRVGPIPADTDARDRLRIALEAASVPHGRYRPLFWPGPGEDGTLSAAEAVAAGLFEAEVRDRAAALERLDVDPDRAEIRGVPTGVVSVPGERRTVAGPFGKAAIIPIDRAIDDTLVASVKRRIEAAREAGAEAIFFEVDSPGGLVSSSMELGDLVFDLDLPTVMLIFKGAYSGAALFALAGDEIVMGEGGILGDCQPIAVGPGGYEVIGEKIQSPLRAVFRKYATRNGYPVALAESMITEQMAVDRVEFADGAVLYLTPDRIEEEKAAHGDVTRKKSVVKEGALLTLHAKEAYEHGFCGPFEANRETALARFGLAPDAAPVLEENWAEETSRLLLALKGLLFLVGIMALYMELKVPGFGVPGTIAIVCFVLFFSASMVAGISTGLEVILFGLGVLLIALELLVIPGFGVPGIAGLVLVVASLYMASVKYGLPSFDRPWEVRGSVGWLIEFGGAFVMSILGMLVIARLLPGTRIGRRLILAPAGAPGEMGLTGSASVLGSEAAPLVGRSGRATTDLRPSGRIEVGGEPYDAVTEGDYIENGAEVTVLVVKGNRIVVGRA